MGNTSASYSGDQGFISQAGNRLLLLVCCPFTYFSRNIPAQDDKWGTIASSHIFSNSLFSVHPTWDDIYAKWDQSIVYPLLYKWTVCQLSSGRLHVLRRSWCHDDCTAICRSSSTCLTKTTVAVWYRGRASRLLTDTICLPQ